MAKLNKILILIALLGLASPLSAFANSVSFDCKFELYASQDGLQKAKNFNLKFMMDTVTGKAVIVGNMGMSDVVPFAGEFGITFIEVLSTGAVQSTTITNKTGDAVHSRHTLIQGNEIMPSQYYGKCS